MVHLMILDIDNLCLLQKIYVQIYLLTIIFLKWIDDIVILDLMDQSDPFSFDNDNGGMVDSCWLGLATGSSLLCLRGYGLLS